MQSAPAERLGLLRSQIQAHALGVLGIEASQTLDWQQPLQELGLDSLMALELRNALGAMIERQLPATLLFDHPTIAGLTEYLAHEVLPSQPTPVPTAKSRRAAGRTADLLERVESLSEDEVERLLKEKL